MTITLTKSKIAAFEQCAKRLWLSVHRPELADRSEVPARSASGQSVGKVARDLRSGGVLIDAVDVTAALDATRDLLGMERPPTIFEAALIHEGVLVRIDILEPDGEGGWHLVEVKSATDVKDHYRPDLATQVWVALGAGLRISDAVIRHVDRAFVLTRDDCYDGAFVDAPLLQAVADLVADRPAVALAARTTLAGPEPARPTGPHCSAPVDCEFAAHCRAAGPAGPEWPVTILPNGGGKKWAKLGIVDLLDVPAEDLSNPTHLKVHRATVTGDHFHDRSKAQEEIGAWPHPRIWLDFETIAFPLPRWVGVRAYEQVPFQFSAHIEHMDGRIEHREFLSIDGRDPRRPCAEALVQLPASGAVVAYNASFERGCLERLAVAFPDLAASLLSLASRLVDLLPVARATWYHRDQRGSWSIKAVLPTVTDLTYEGLEVANGTAAQEAYLEAVSGAPAERIAALDLALRRYCRRDTEAMIALARRLVSEVGLGA